MDALNGKARTHLCASHFSHFDYRKTTPYTYVLRSDAVPSYTEKVEEFMRPPLDNEIKEKSLDVKDEPTEELGNASYEEPISKDTIHYAIDITNEMNEEQVEIKNDPIDDFAEFGQPIADLFCPSTGT
ncbi:hypothetical protein PMAYCL1PPCAC_05022, partial [Pristionchus mayeri]